MHKVRHLFLGASHFFKKNYNYFFPILQEYSILFLSLLHCRGDLLKFILSIIMVKKGYLRDFEGGMVVGVRQLLWVFQKLLISQEISVKDSKTEKISHEQQFSGLWADRKTTVMHFLIIIIIHSFMTKASCYKSQIFPNCFFYCDYEFTVLKWALHSENLNFNH